MQPATPIQTSSMGISGGYFHLTPEPPPVATSFESNGTYLGGFTSMWFMMSRVVTPKYW